MRLVLAFSGPTPPASRSRRTKGPLRAAPECRLHDGGELSKCRGLILPCNGATLQRSGGAIGPKGGCCISFAVHHSAAKSFVRSGACNVKSWRAVIRVRGSGSGPANLSTLKCGLSQSWRPALQQCPLSEAVRRTYTHSEFY